MELLLAVAEDSATLRSDMSAVYGVGGESDATDIALFFVTAITAKRRWLRGRNASIASYPMAVDAGACSAGYAGAMQALHPASQVFVPPSMRFTIRHHSPWKTSKRKTSGPGRAR